MCAHEVPSPMTNAQQLLTKCLISLMAEAQNYLFSQLWQAIESVCSVFCVPDSASSLPEIHCRKISRGMSDIDYGKRCAPQHMLMSIFILNTYMNKYIVICMTRISANTNVWQEGNT